MKPGGKDGPAKLNDDGTLAEYIYFIQNKLNPFTIKFSQIAIKGDNVIVGSYFLDLLTFCVSFPLQDLGGISPYDLCICIKYDGVVASWDVDGKGTTLSHIIRGREENGRAIFDFDEKMVDCRLCPLPKNIVNIGFTMRNIKSGEETPINFNTEYTMEVKLYSPKLFFNNIL